MAKNLIISMIMATTRNCVVGKGNGLPWDSKEDMSWFVKNTKGKAILLGRTTLEGIGKVLPNRLNLVLSRDPEYHFEGAITVTSVEDAIALAVINNQDELVICGGPQVYDLSLPYVERLYLTMFRKDYEGDVVYKPNMELHSVVEIGEGSFINKVGDVRLTPNGKSFMEEAKVAYFYQTDQRDGIDAHYITYSRLRAQVPFKLTAEEKRIYLGVRGVE